MKRIAGTVNRKHVTALMLQTLRLLRATSPPIATMSKNEANRVHALRDKGLAKITSGSASPTAAGRKFIERIDHEQHK